MLPQMLTQFVMTWRNIVHLKTRICFVLSTIWNIKVSRISLPLKMILRSQNTFWGEKFFLQFSPENDLPTKKNLKFWSLVSGILTLEGVFRGHLTQEIRKRSFQSSPDFSNPRLILFYPILDEIGQKSRAHIFKSVEIGPKTPPPPPL